MTERDIRLECLRLVLDNSTGTAEQIIEKAEAFYRFIIAVEKSSASSSPGFTE